MRRSQVVVAMVTGLLAATVPAVAHPSSTTHPVKRVQADYYRFCSWSAPMCSPSDTNHRTHVVVGTRVRWIYRDTACDAYSSCPGHDVKVAHHTRSAIVKKDGAVIFSMVFNSVGTFNYWCTVHRGEGMTGRIVVTRR